MDYDPRQRRADVAHETVDQAAIDADKLARIRELHSPVPIPEGKRWMGGDGPDDAPCAGCRTGDPFLDPTWPCETREIADEGMSA